MEFLQGLIGEHLGTYHELAPREFVHVPSVDGTFVQILASAIISTDWLCFLVRETIFQPGSRASTLRAPNKVVVSL